jgi:hypothetical protein
MTLTNQTQQVAQPELTKPLDMTPEQRNPYRVPDELGEDISARPMTLPDFANDIKPHLNNPNLWPRWIFTDKRRYAQARAQGWRNCTAKDLKPGFATLSPYSEEGGTKFINGDLILMVIDRKTYLGALRYKHDVAARLSDVSIGRRVSGEKAVADLGPQVAAINRQRMQAGHDPAITVFTPGASDITVPASETSRINAGAAAGRDMGTAADLAKGLDALRGPAKSVST